MKHPLTLEEYTSGDYTTPIKRIRQCGWEWPALHNKPAKDQTFCAGEE